ncbi:MAG: hypothetical protein LBC99_00325 [Spirochaetota bacterium]|nr:hypothetical protein [Spirochaetota bacterium]
MENPSLFHFKPMLAAMQAVNIELRHPCRTAHHQEANILDRALVSGER